MEYLVKKEWWGKVKLKGEGEKRESHRNKETFKDVI